MLKPVWFATKRDCYVIIDFNACMRDRGQNHGVLTCCSLVVQSLAKKELTVWQFTNRNILFSNKCKGSMANIRKYDDSYTEPAPEQSILGVKRVSGGRPKFEIKHKSRCLQKSKLVNWGGGGVGQACQLGGQPPPPLGAGPVAISNLGLL